MTRWQLIAGTRRAKVPPHEARPATTTQRGFSERTFGGVVAQLQGCLYGGWAEGYPAFGRSRYFFVGGRLLFLEISAATRD